MKPETKIVNETSEYKEQEGWYRGNLIQFRVYKRIERMEIRFTNDLARAYGLKDVQELIDKLDIRNEVAIGGIPDWVELAPDGIRWEGKMNVN